MWVRPEAREGLRGRWGASSPRHRLLIPGILLLVLVGGAVLATHTPIFSARTITVRGASHLSETMVLHLAGVHPGTNVFYLDTDTARASLVADPWVSSATVIRSLPSTVEITVREVRPIGVTASAETPLLLAQDGTLLGPAPDGTRLPVIGTAGERSVSGATAVLGAMPPPLLARVETVAVATDGSIALTLRDGVTVTFGDGSGAGRKVEALRAVLTWARSQPIGVLSIDVSSPAVPTARLRGTTAATAIAPPPPVPPSPSPTASP